MMSQERGKIEKGEEGHIKLGKKINWEVRLCGTDGTT